MTGGRSIAEPLLPLEEESSQLSLSQPPAPLDGDLLKFCEVIERGNTGSAPEMFGLALRLGPR